MVIVQAADVLVVQALLAGFAVHGVHREPGALERGQ